MNSEQKERLQSFASALNELIETNDRYVVIHSSLMPFGHIFRLPGKELVYQISQTILEVLGPQRTLVLPAYVSSFPRTKIFDLTDSKPFTGALPLSFMNKKDSIRAAKPMNSYVAYGPNAQNIADCPGPTCWGEGSIMNLLLQNNAKFIAMGLPFYLSCSYYHLAEERLRVPYRYFKRFTGELYDKGAHIGQCEETMFCRPMGFKDFSMSYEPIDKTMHSRNDIKSPNDDRFMLSGSSMAQIYDASLETLKDDPYILCDKPEELKHWVENHLQSEIDALSPEQTPQWGKAA